MDSSRRGRLAVLVVGLLSFDAGLAGGLDPEFDHLGNALVVTNRFDGETYQVHIAQVARNGTLMRSFPHADGYQEVAKALDIDGNGNAAVAGVRYWQGRSFFWLMKYHPSSNWAWEWSDDQPDCVAETVAANAEGDAWIAGLCNTGAGRILRVVRLGPGGARVWGQTYDLGGAKSVRNLSVDFGNRVSVTTLTGQGASPGIRTLVYGPFGERTVEY